MLLWAWMALACVGGSASRPTSRAGAEVPVDVMVVSASIRANEVDALGTVQADAVIAVRAEVGGRVREVGFSDGEVVQSGQVLVRLVDVAARADRDSAAASLKLAEANLARGQTLSARAQLGDAELDGLVAARDIAQASLLRNEDALRRTVVRAPSAGRVGIRQVFPGDMIETTRVITELVDADPLRIEAVFSERLVGQLTLGQAVRFSPASPGMNEVGGALTFIAPALDQATRSVVVRADLEQGSGLLPGMTGVLRLTLGESPPVVRLPAEAVLTVAGGAEVWVVEEGSAHTRQVQVGRRIDDSVEVRDGLRDGDQVVVAGIVRLREGARVSVQSTVAQ